MKRCAAHRSEHTIAVDHLVEGRNYYFLFGADATLQMSGATSTQVLTSQKTKLWCGEIMVCVHLLLVFEWQVSGVRGEAHFLYLRVEK